jgi:hypothetical protein
VCTELCIAHVGEKRTKEKKEEAECSIRVILNENRYLITTGCCDIQLLCNRELGKSTDVGECWNG